MCLTIKQRFQSFAEARDFIANPPITEDDVTVFKILQIDNNEFKGPYTRFKYEKGFQYTEDTFTFDICGPSWRSFVDIRRGLHVYTTISKAIEVKNNLAKCGYNNEKYEVFFMTVPKGSKFILGENGDAVTDNLIWN